MTAPKGLPSLELWQVYIIIVAVMAVMYWAARVDIRNAYSSGWNIGFRVGLECVPVLDDPKPKRKQKERDTGA